MTFFRVVYYNKHALIKERNLKMKIGSVLKEYRTTHDLSMQEFADRSGLSKGYISMLEKGTHPQNGKEIIPSIETVQKIASVMGISVDTLLEMVDSDQRIDISVPVYEAAAGEGRLNDGYPSEEYKIQLEPEEFVVKVVGRSMEPTLLDGDIVIMTAQSVLDYPHQIALVKVDGEESTIKRVEVREDGIMLIGDNIDVYPPHFYTVDQVEQLPVTIEGVLTKLIREFR